MGVCPDLHADIAVLIQTYESSREAQGDMQQVLARAARARIAQEQAAALSETLESDLDSVIKLEVQPRLHVFILYQCFWQKSQILVLIFFFQKS